MQGPGRSVVIIAVEVMRKLLHNEDGGTTLEWALLLVVIALPSYYLIQTALAVLLAHYRMMTTINALPFP